MTISQIDKNTALIIIDLQKGIVTIPGAHGINDVIKNAASLADAFRTKKLPVVLVNAVGIAPGRTEQRFSLKDLPADFAELVPELNRHADDYTISKRTWGAFTATELEKILKSRNVTQVVVAGVATSFGVESTARQAYELGFNVTLATDAMTDRSPQSHENSLAQIFPRLGETGTTSEIIEMLANA
jgi:nicotinamidase-related amidase